MSTMRLERNRWIAGHARTTAGHQPALPPTVHLTYNGAVTATVRVMTDLLTGYAGELAEVHLGPNPSGVEIGDLNRSKEAMEKARDELLGCIPNFDRIVFARNWVFWVWLAEDMTAEQ